MSTKFTVVNLNGIDAIACNGQILRVSEVVRLLNLYVSQHKTKPDVREIEYLLKRFEAVGEGK